MIEVSIYLECIWNEENWENFKSFKGPWHDDNVQDLGGHERSGNTEISTLRTSESRVGEATQKLLF